MPSRQLSEQVPPSVLSPAVGPQDQTTAVRSQIWIKETFGEFAYRPTGGGRFTIDPAWVEANIVAVRLPLLRETRCHRLYAEKLIRRSYNLWSTRGTPPPSIAMPSSVAGTPGTLPTLLDSRAIPGARRRTSTLATHSTADRAPPCTRVLLAEMAANGITSGHAWSIPDPGHFEYYGFPTPRSIPE